uniref:ATP synthase subunit a n=1 Tax=Saussurella borneensis TaxID=510017 RepID=A0A8F2JFH1_9ORTH|nr:ATP synthase F0 subunit 6 [Saussurella borneensis]
MMTNLFSTFDPTTNIMNMSINWLSTTLIIMFTPMTFWALTTRSKLLINNIFMTLHKEFKTLLGKSNGMTMLFISLFLFIMMNNLLGLFPYIFTSTSHMTMTLSMALPLWMSFMIFGWTKKTNHMFEHMVPMGTPPMLMPFMVLIETISNLIRPGTLAVRLCANMIAGHLLLTLMGSTGVSLSGILLMSMLSIQILLVILESAVSIIQAYVFSVLATLYASEVN